MADFDIDSTIANLERKLGSGGAPTIGSDSPSQPSYRRGGSVGMVKKGVISALLSGATIYFLKPLWLYNVKYDDKTDKCKPKLKLMKTITTFLVLTIIFYFASKRIL